MNDSTAAGAAGGTTDPPEDAAARARAEAEAAAAAHPVDPPSPGTGVADAGVTHAPDEEPVDAGPKSTDDLKDELIDKAGDELDQIGKFLADAIDVSVGAVEAKATTLVTNSSLMTRALNYVPAEFRGAASDVIRTGIAGELPSAGHLVTDDAKKGLVLGLGWLKVHLRALRS